jgi:hypothetical protein
MSNSGLIPGVIAFEVAQKAYRLPDPDVRLAQLRVVIWPFFDLIAYQS